MAQIHKDLMTYGLIHKLMSPKAIKMNIKNILKKMKELDSNPPEELTTLIPDFHNYFDKDGRYLTSEIPNYLEYKYERMRILAMRAFSGNPDLPNVLKIIDIYHTQHKEAIELDTVGNQSPEERCGEIADISMAISKVVGGGNIDQSTENFRYKMISALSVTNNMDRQTWVKISKNIKPVEEIAIQTLCAAIKCNEIANSQCICGDATYCSIKCKDKDWKNGHKDTCSAVNRSNVNKCAECDKPKPGKTCSCRLVHYCDERCQKLHRKVHKDICKTTMAEMAEKAISEKAMAEKAIAEKTIAEKAMAENEIAEKAIAEKAIAENEILSFLEEVIKQGIVEEKNKKFF